MSGVDRGHLLHRHRLAGRQLHREVVTDFGVPGKQPTSHRHGCAVTAQGVPRGHGDRDAGLSGLHGQQDRIVREFAGLRGPEMLVGQLPVPLDQRVRHVPSRVERNSMVPDQSSATTVVSRAPTWARCMATNRRCTSALVRPTSSRKRTSRVSTAPRRSSTCRYDSTVTASMSNQSPSSIRKVSESQFGRLTRLSLSIRSPATSSTSRLYTPAT